MNLRGLLPSKEAYNANHFGGDMASTQVLKPEVHAELQPARKTDCKLS